MPSYVTPRKNIAYVFSVSLVSQASTKTFQANPTLATGDVVVVGDSGSTANITTLPTVDSGQTKRVIVSLSAAEMNFDNIVVLFSDAAGAQWCDLSVNIQSSARQIDDLSTYSGGAVASVTGAVGSVATGGIVAASFGAGAITSTVAPNLDAAVSSRSTYAGGAVASVTARVTANVDQIGGQTVVASTSVTVGSYVGNNTSLFAVDGSGHVTAGTVADKTGYTLTQAFPANFSALGISAGGHIVTVDTLTNLPAITANWLTATGINATALNGKGDWMASYTQPTGFLATVFAGTVGTSTYAGGAVASVTGSVGSVVGDTVQTGDVYTYLTSALTESYAAAGATVTVAQALYEILANICEVSFVGTSGAFRKRDHVTTAGTITLDSATLPTLRKRAT